MTEDFVGTSGKLEEEFVYAPNNNLRTEVFVRFEQWAAQEKPLLLPGLMALKEKMGTWMKLQRMEQIFRVDRNKGFRLLVSS